MVNHTCVAARAANGGDTKGWIVSSLDGATNIPFALVDILRVTLSADAAGAGAVALVAAILDAMAAVAIQAAVVLDGLDRRHSGAATTTDGCPCIRGMAVQC